MVTFELMKTFQAAGACVVSNRHLFPGIGPHVHLDVHGELRLLVQGGSSWDMGG